MQQSFTEVQKISSAAASLFYDHLFELDPT